MDPKPHGSESPTASDIAKQAPQRGGYTQWTPPPPQCPYPSNSSPSILGQPPHQATQPQENTALADPYNFLEPPDQSFATVSFNLADQTWYMDQPTDLSTMSFNPVDQPWYMDTGASSHMTNNTEMDPKPHGSESPTASDIAKQEVATSKHSVDQPLASSIHSLISTDANTTKCYFQCSEFFAEKAIPFNVLISYWMMAGFLGRVGSVEEACQKGEDMLKDLIQKGILRIVYDGDRDMIEFVKYGQGMPLCRHQGCCVPESFGVAAANLGITDSIILTDGMLKQRKVAPKVNYQPEGFYRKTQGEKYRYIAQFDPTIDSVKPLLENPTNLDVLLLRGCGELLPLTTFPLDKLKTLTVLELSGCTHLTTITEDTICELKELRYLNLSHLLIQSLTPLFFFQFEHLKVLILRGCSNLRSISLFNPNLMTLDLSYCTALREIEGPVGSSLDMVDLSHTALTCIPDFDLSSTKYLFLRDSKLKGIYLLLNKDCIEVLDLSGGWEMNDTQFEIPRNLKVLDLSRTQVECFPCGYFLETLPLRCLLLRECTSLQQLPVMKFFLNLEVLDVSGCDKLLGLPKDFSLLENLKDLNLSGCSGLGILPERLFNQMSSLLKLDLSGLNVTVLPSLVSLTNLSTLSLRGLQLHSLDSLASLSSLVELDLKCLQIISPSSELRLDFLQSFEKLQILNLSETSVVQLPNLSKLGSLKQLLLADCRRLIAVPDLQNLTNLETLDLSVSLSLMQDESEPHKVIHLSAPSSLRKLVLTNRSGLQNLFALTSLGSLEFLDLRGTDVTSIPRQYMEQIKCINLPAGTVFSEVGQSKMGNLEEATDRDDNLLRRVSNPFEIHIVSFVGTSLSKQPFEIHGVASSSNQPSGFGRFSDGFKMLYDLISEMQERVKSSMVSGTTVGVAQTLELERLLSDVSHIDKNKERLESSQNEKEAEELLQELMNATTHLSAADFLDDSTTYLKQLLRIVIKLKLLIPHEIEKASQVTHKKKKKEKKPWFNKNEENDIVIAKDSSSHEFQHLLSSYVCLSVFEKRCLLCFSVFPLEKDKNDGGLKSLVVKKRMLIYLWVGEGFLDYSTADMSSEEAGKAVLRVLEDKGFIQPVMEKGRESGSCCMLPFVREFVIAKAKEEGFFDLNPKNGKLTPHFNRSQRACLLKAHETTPSSCRLWANDNYHHKNQESYKNVHTLFNVNEPVVDIKPEWFSKMKDLRVLHLGSWSSNHQDPIEVYDVKFLEELKSMKIMRLLSLHGLSRVIKLPDSVCKLINLIILDLRECTDLEELPADIGSLKSLTHLDLTGCIYLSEFPKGIRLLLKLEVLKGFVITIQSCDPQNTKAAQLQDLLNLNKLRKLNIVARINVFPGDQELQVLKDMDSLSKLKITWEKDFNFTAKEWFSYPETITNGQKAVLRPSKWKKKLKWWSRSQEDREETSTNRRLSLGNIEKLELWCYPFETAPHWLNPGELKSLKKLYMSGGNLAKLHCDTNQDKWNVTTLRLKFLPNLEMGWRDLKNMFPDLTYLEKHQCPRLPFTWCDDQGVWIHGREEY